MWRIALVLAAVVAAFVGVVLYAVSPGVLSYQLSWILVLPAGGLALWWLHRHLPIRLQWAVALVLAPIGPLGYLLAGGSQWWAWGQLTAAPLVALAVARGIDPGAESDGSGAGGFTDGPWGPP